jgi:RimJ/RimL family protein N-acetyltransferase
MKHTPRFELRAISDTPSARQAVAALFEECADYFVLVEGCLPSSLQTEDFFTGIPEGFTLHDVLLHAVIVDGKWVGVTSLLMRWNRPDKCMLGLMLLNPRVRGNGLGQAVLAELERVVQGDPAMRVIRVGVVATNVAATGFWRKMGFAETGETKSRPEFVAPIIIFEKSLE